MKQAPVSFVQVLWVLFAMAGVLTAAFAVGIRLLFRRGKSPTDL